MTQQEAGFEFDPFSLAVQDDPYPFYKVMRDRYPLYWSEKGKCWALSRYEDIVHAAHHPELYSSAQGNILDDFPGRAGSTLGTSDPPKHNHLRSLINEVFTRKRVTDLEPKIRESAVEHTRRYVRSGGGCILEQLTGKVSTGVISALLGLNDIGLDSLKGWVDGSLQRDPETQQLTDHGRKCLEALLEYVRDEVDRRYKDPKDDLIDSLIRVNLAGDTLTKDEIKWLVFTLIAAGIESSSSVMGNSLAALADHPEQRDYLARDPSAIPGAVEECLRYDTSAQRFRRTAMRDIELHGQRINEGDKVLLMYGSANRDERQFNDPDRFDVRRKPTRHLGFGHGIHVCLGAALARLTIKVVLEEILAQMPRYIIDKSAATRMHSPTFRGYATLPVNPNSKADRSVVTTLQSEPLN